MFKESKVTRLSVPGWHAVYRSEINPGVISFIAVHDITRGASLGGSRMARYASESEALTDVLRLSRGMTYKNAAASLPLGGGKAVIVCDPGMAGKRRRAVLKEFGRFVKWVNRSDDIYYTAEDMNTTVADMHVVKNHTRHVYGIEVDPSPYTAVGVFAAAEFTVEYFAREMFGGDGSLSGKRVFIQGVGKVGMILVRMFRDAGAQLTICDVRPGAVREAKRVCPGVRVVAPDRVLAREIDIFVPCAGGEVIRQAEAGKAKFKILCGGANNQLPNAETGRLLHERGIVYCPDYVANMGGVCSLQYIEAERLSEPRAIRKIEGNVRRMLKRVFKASARKDIPYNIVVDEVVEQILRRGR
jgi:leucine dehydrogenase